MAEKHKSKYKAPKDLEKSQKTNARKDLKDYTFDDKEGGMNPKSTKEKQLNVLRKTDKPMQDDGKMYPTYNADDRLYKDLEDAIYEPKDAAKKMKKRQDKEEKETIDVLQDKIENLTREQKERLVREYIRTKIVKILREQTEETPAEETPAEETPTEEVPTTDQNATGAEVDPNAATPAPAAEPTTEPSAEPAAQPTTEPSAEPTTEPSAEPEKELDPAAQEALAVQKFVNHLREKEVGNIARIKALSKVMNSLMKDAEPGDRNNFYTLLRQLAISKLQKKEK